MKSTLERNFSDDNCENSFNEKNKSLVSIYGNFTAEIIYQYNIVKIALAAANKIFLNREEINKLLSCPISLILRIAETANNLHFYDSQKVINPILYCKNNTPDIWENLQQNTLKTLNDFTNHNRIKEVFFKFYSLKTKEDFLIIGNIIKQVNLPKILISKSDVVNINTLSPFLSKPYLLELDNIEDYQNYQKYNFDINFKITLNTELVSLSERSNNFLDSLFKLRQFNTRNLSRLTLELPYELDTDLEDMKSTLGLETLQYIIFARLIFPEVEEISINLNKIGVKLGKTALLFGATNLGFAAIDESTSNFLSLPQYQSISEELNKNVEYSLEQ